MCVCVFRRQRRRREKGEEVVVVSLFNSPSKAASRARAECPALFSTSFSHDTNSDVELLTQRVACFRASFAFSERVSPEAQLFNGDGDDGGDEEGEATAGLWAGGACQSQFRLSTGTIKTSMARRRAEEDIGIGERDRERGGGEIFLF